MSKIGNIRKSIDVELMSRVRLESQMESDVEFERYKIDIWRYIYSEVVR